MIAPLPPNETERLEALASFAILDTPDEADYDDLARLAANICQTPIALVTLIDSQRQWFKARFGIDAKETSRDIAFCAHAILQEDVFVVQDSTLDDRFTSNPLVTGEPHIRFYAGMPLTAPGGHNLGTLCVIDRVPRDWTWEQSNALRVLGRQVVTQLLLRRQVQRAAEVEAELRASDQRFRAFMASAPIAAFMKDADGRYTYVNETVERRFGKPSSDWVGNTDETLYPNEFSAVWRENDRRVLAGGGAEEFCECVPLADGRLSHWTTYKFPFRDLSGRLYLAGIGVDITEKKRVEDALRASEAKFRGTVDRLAEGVFVVDAATERFVEANAAFLSTLGYTLEEFLALEPYDIVAGEAPEAYARDIAEMRAKLAREGRCDMGRRQYRRKDGSVVPVDVRISVIPNGGSGLHAVIVHDVTEQIAHEDRLFEYQLVLEEANARLRALATTDGLTGVNNRAAFNARLIEEFDRATRYEHPLALIMMDVDHFKSFNDAFGHPAGDEVLKAVADSLQKTARATDFVARYGGEEFAMILSDTDHAGAMVLAERCRRAIAGRPWDKRTITVSIGVSVLSPAVTDGAGMIRLADEALYRSKQAGRNRVSNGSPVGVHPALKRS